jgi:hypothetical protein
MQLPPLPLIDGQLFLDNSFIELLTTCPRALQYSQLSKRISAEENAALNFGTAIHSCLEYRYREYKNIMPDIFCEEEQGKILQKFYEDHPVPGEDWRNLNWAIELNKKYNERYQIEPFNLLLDAKGVPLVELSFALPLCTLQKTPIIYTGRIDLPVMWDDQLFIVDNKTTSMLGPQFFDGQRMSAQHRGYCWAFQEKTGMAVRGFAVNAIRTKEPPQYVLNGTERDWRGKKLRPEDWWKESFQREKFYLGDGELEYWKQNLIELIEEFLWRYQRGYFPMKTKWCAMYGKCQYYEVCTTYHADRDLRLAMGDFTDNTWTPLKIPTNEAINT